MRASFKLLCGLLSCAMAAACALAALGAQFGRTSARWDLLAQFAHVWLFGAVFALIVGLAALRGMARLFTIALACIAVAASGALIAPEFLRTSGPAAVAGAPDQLKVIQLNAWADNVDPVGTVNWLIAQRPDIVALEEAPPAIRKLIAARGQWYSDCDTCPVMILSRTRPVSVSLIWHSGLQVMTLTRATYRDRRGPFSFIAVHWPRPTNPSFQQRQEHWLALALAAGPRERTILVGDFNSTPWSFSRRRSDDASGLIRRDRALFSWPTGHFLGPSWLPPAPVMPIDHVYAGADWATVSVRRGPALGSDHYPVVMTLVAR